MFGFFKDLKRDALIEQEKEIERMYGTLIRRIAEKIIIQTKQKEPEKDFDNLSSQDQADFDNYILSASLEAFPNLIDSFSVTEKAKRLLLEYHLIAIDAPVIGDPLNTEMEQMLKDQRQGIEAFYQELQDTARENVTAFYRSSGRGHVTRLNNDVHNEVLLNIEDMRDKDDTLYSVLCSIHQEFYKDLSK